MAEDGNTRSKDNAIEKKSRKIAREVLSWVKVIAAAVIIAWAVDSFVIANVKVPSGSMEETVPAGARMIGFRLSYKFSEPERGDIVIFRYPDDREVDFLKRIIGLPGETVTIRDGLVYINDSEEPLEEDYITQEVYGDFGPYEVPEDSYFMLGDNRAVSKDSRYWENTFVPREDILAKVVFMYYPSFHYFSDGE
ncbi:MAG: signal peptidase I [Lachnospiraceae bacterium]|nr:signal peptidase I [Lachnospiraceae bacterium]